MPKIDVDTYIEHCGMRKARFGGYEPEDVRQAKTRLIALLQACGHRGKMADCVMDAVFALAEDWDAADFKVYEEQLILILI